MRQVKKVAALLAALAIVTVAAVFAITGDYAYSEINADPYIAAHEYIDEYDYGDIAMYTYDYPHYSNDSDYEEYNHNPCQNTYYYDDYGWDIPTYDSYHIGDDPNPYYYSDFTASGMLVPFVTQYVLQYYVVSNSSIYNRPPLSSEIAAADPRWPWQPYLNPPLPLVMAGTNAVRGYWRPRFGQSNIGMPSIPASGQWGISTTGARQTMPAGLHTYYYRALTVTPGNIVRQFASFVELEIPAVDADDNYSVMDLVSIGRRVVGYNNPPTRNVTLRNNTIHLTAPFPHVPTFPDYSTFPGTGFPPIPPCGIGGASAPYIGNPNFHARFITEMQSQPGDFYFVALGNLPVTTPQPVDIVSPVNPRDTHILPITVPPHQHIGTYTDTVLVRHGPAVVGEFDIEFTVERPVLEIVVDNQDRPNQDVDVTLNVRDIWPDQPGPTPTPEQRDLDTETLPYTRTISGSDREIVVRIPRPDEYTVFYFDCECDCDCNDPDNCNLCCNEYCYKDILITPPRGYIEIPGTRRIERDGDEYYEEFLVVEFIRAFIFTKTDMGIYDENNPVVNPLDGAVFYVYAWENGAWGTTPVYGPTTSGTNVTTTNGNVIEVGTGQIVITHNFTNGNYRLVERAAPSGSALPSGYWRLHTHNTYHDVVDVTEHSSNLPFVPIGSLGGPPTSQILSIWHVGNRPNPDWIRLNHAINIMNPPPEYIVIHPADSGETEGMANPTTFYLVITDPNPDPFYEGRTITTLPISLPAPGAPAAHPHRISVTRQVTVQAANGADIILRMPIPNTTNTADIYPWAVTVPVPGRHFIVGTGGDFTLGAVGNGTLTVDGNRAALSGNRGGVLVESGIFAMQEGSAISNSRAITGGGVMVSGPNSTFNMYGGLIGHAANSALGNVADFGGGVAVTDGASFNMIQGPGNTYGTIARNATTIASGSPGAGITTGNHIGGGVFVRDADSSFDMAAGYIRNNSGRGGGGVAIYGFLSGNNYVTFTMTGGVIEQNESAGSGSSNIASVASGGGVLVAGDNAIFIMDNGRIRYNDTPSWSGAGVTVMARADFTMNYGHIYRNDAAPAQDSGDSGGGGVAARHAGVFTMKDGYIFENNSFVGGGVLAYNQGIVIIEGGEIFENTLNSPIVLGGAGIAAIANATIEMSGGIIRDHNAHGDRQGGGVWVGELLSPPAAHLAGPSHFHMSGGIITNNEAHNGGGVHVRGGQAVGIPGSGIPHGTFTMTGGYITNNEARANGGGVHVIENGIFSMHDGTIGGATSALANTAVRGGGVYVYSGASFYMEDHEYDDNGNIIITPGDGHIIGNEATRGGGVYVVGSLAGQHSSMTLQAGTIEYNTATFVGATSEGGGGINLEPQTNLTMSGGYIRNNITYNSGGGVNVRAALFNMSGGTISGNTTATAASGNGGGVHITSHNGISGNFNMSGGEIIENVSLRHGGGIHSYRSIVTMQPNLLPGQDDGRISGNVAHMTGGGVSIYDPPTAPGSPPAQFTMNAGTISNNGRDTNGDVQTTQGGGIFAGRGVRIEMHGGAIYGNAANISGGGVHIDILGQSAEFFMTNGRIGGECPSGFAPGATNPYSNTAPNGGGVWVGSEASFTMGTVPTPGAFIGSPFIIGNIATQSGGGIHVREDATFAMYNGQIKQNATSYHDGGGIYLDDDAAFYLRGYNAKVITGNSARFGGGVFVSETAHMTMVLPGALNVYITYNTATQRGGGIYTGDFEYGNPLTRTSGPNIAYGNLTLYDVNFNNNTAGHREFSPVNALDVIPNTAWNSLSVDIHPLNNYDINFIGNFDLPLTGATVTRSWFAIGGGVMLAMAASGMVAIHVGKRRRIGLWAK